MVVTGPTVIMPPLRYAWLRPRVASLLKWEGIVNDPIEALLAALVFEYLIVAPHAESFGETLGAMRAAVAVADGNRHHLHTLRLAGIPTVYGDARRSARSNPQSCLRQRRHPPAG